MAARLSISLAWLLLCACDSGARGDADRGPIEATLSSSDRAAWPGVDTPTGRLIPFIFSFVDGHPTGYWFLGFGTRRTADSFWFCRQGESACPLDEHQRLSWQTLVGHPLFTRLPGDPDASPYWQMWKVTVPDNYAPDAIKTIETLDRLRQAGSVRVEPFIVDFGRRFGENVGSVEVVLHCALVLAGTELQDNGGPMPGGTGNMLRLEARQGWFNGYHVNLVDFSVSDGVLPAAADSEGRPKMRFANIYVLWRMCNTTPRPSICDLPNYPYADKRPVSERGLGQDITGDGTTNDGNNVLGAQPCKLLRPTELPYSPLWGPQEVDIVPPANPGLIDTYRDASRSDIMSAGAMFDAVTTGVMTAPIPMLEDETGEPVPGSEGRVFFNCPSPVPEGYVPYPCEANP